MLKKLTKNAKISLSILLIIIGICFIGSSYFSGIKSNLFNQKNIELTEYISLTEPPEELIELDNIDEVEVKEVNEKLERTQTYIGYLSIPKLKLKRGFLNFNDKYNSVNYNVMLIKGSDMPDKKNGNLILAAHRGNSSVSFFDKLYTLPPGTKAYIKYKGKEYTYALKESYEDKKDGTITVVRDGSKKVLTLITCTKYNKKTQTVFIFEEVK